MPSVTEQALISIICHSSVSRPRAAREDSVSEARDNSMGIDSLEFWSDHDKMVELISKDSIGQEYHDIVSDERRIEECLYHPDPHFRLLALQLCGNRWNPSPEAKLRVLELAKLDPSDIVLAVAIVQIGTPPMSSSIPGTEISDSYSGSSPQWLSAVQSPIW